ncbi:sugar ABC transporter permease [Caldilinea sp.]|uniref:carbohydrate ABC transporter permease n=1 Tax=Caldilinea sp. TaxID=2293560 RepID=UPI002B944637|nr:sugar ABC transporter permease [Anaerolineales bacterium]HQY92618.1 sugar ABC transporter permease [Caldilinea sp.]HRA64785.1 sugar ABC transporter permease [Caldilinea sp.]
MDWIRKRLRLSARGWLPFWVILPALLVIAAIQLYPTIYTVILSLQQIEPGTGQFIFVGARNFERLFGSIAFMRSLVHTVVFLLGYVTLTLGASFAIALLLRQRLRLTPLYITLIFVPWIISDIVAGAVWRLFVVPDYGLFSPFFANPALFGEPNGISILTSVPPNQLGPRMPLPPAPALLFLIVASTWKILPFTTLLILGALQTVSPEVQESAKIDGASNWQLLLRIILPLIKPMLAVTLFYLILGGINGVGMVFSLTGGGPGTSTEVISYLLYSIGFSKLDFGLAGALSVFIAVLNFGLIALTLKLSAAYEEH